MKSTLFSPFKVRLFLAVWVATLLSNFGMQIHTMAAGWLMLRLDSSPQTVALVQVAASLPYMLFALLAGALSDIYDKRKIMLTAQLFSVAAAAALAYFTYHNMIGPLGLLFLVMMIAAGSSFYSPAWAASVSSMLPRKYLAQAISLNAINFNLGRSLAPALGGMLITMVGVAWAFILNTLSYLGIVAVLWRWKPENGEVEPDREPIPWAVSMGLRYAFRTDYIRVVLLRTVFCSLGAGIFWALMPVLAKQYLGGDATTFTVLLTAMGVGSVIGGVFSTKLRYLVGIQRSTILSEFVIAFSCASIVLGKSVVLSSLATGVLGIAWMVFITNMNSSIQMSAPDWIVGRLLAIWQSAVFMSLAIAGLLWGWVAAEYGFVSAFVLAAGVVILSAVYGFFRPMLGLEEVNSQSAELTPFSMDLSRIETGKSPIVAVVSYTVEREDSSDFLKAMASLRSVRLRLGATRWTLQQDLDNPEVWLERYISKDWQEQKRRPRRYSHDDNEVRLKAASFNVGGPPEASFMAIRDPNNPQFLAEPPLADVEKSDAN